MPNIELEGQVKQGVEKLRIYRMNLWSEKKGAEITKLIGRGIQV